MYDILESLICYGSSCLGWSIVLIDVFAVCYLIFCALYKVSKAVKIFGWVLIAVLLFSVAIPSIMHICVYMILADIFAVITAFVVCVLILKTNGK